MSMSGRSGGNTARKLLSHLSPGGGQNQGHWEAGNHSPVRHQLRGRGNPIKNANDLLCRNGCGFYGNPEWQWYCSKCWRELGPHLHHPHHQHQQHFVQHQQHGRQRSAVGTCVAQGDPHPLWQRFASTGAERRGARPGPAKSPVQGSPQSAKGERRSKYLFWKQKEDPESPISGDGGSPNEAKGLSRMVALDVPSDAKAVQNELSQYIRGRLNRKAVVDLSQNLKSFLDKVAGAETADAYADIDELSSLAQEFYQSLRKRFASHELFRNLTDEECEKIVDLSEKFIMIYCYKHLFCPPTTNDEELDLNLQNRIRQLNWIATKDLGCDINESSQEVRDALHEAINHILEIDGKFAPQDKLDCLAECSKRVFELLKLSNDKLASADEFLPCLIYVCIKANPPRLHSNVNYITRFRNEEKLRMGESGYFFANLCCALSFIENLNADSINMDPETFESYVSGKAVPPGSWKSSLLLCESLQCMSQNLQHLAKIKERNERIMDEAIQLQENMKTCQQEIGDEVRSVLERTKYTIVDGRFPLSLEELHHRPPSHPVTVPKDSLASLQPNIGEENASTEEDQAKGKEMSAVESDAFSGYHGISAQNSTIRSIPCSVAPDSSSESPGDKS